MTSPITAILNSATTGTQRPELGDNFESNLPGLYIIGDLAGAPVVKLAMEQGTSLAQHLAALPDARGADPSIYDLVVIGAGAAGLNCALAAKRLGLRVVVLEKDRLANTIEEFPEGKWIYAEPEGRPSQGDLWLAGATKEELIARWTETVRDAKLDVRTGETVTSLVTRKPRGFEVRTKTGVFPARRVVLATGQRGTPRKLNVPGEQSDRVYHRLYNPSHFENQDIVLVGGGNSSVEAALALAPVNRVTLVHRGTGFSRVFRENRRLLDAAIAAGRVTLQLGQTVREFAPGRCLLASGTELTCDHAFVLIGAEAPTAFLKSLGIRLENEWSGDWPISLALLAAAFGGMWLYQAEPTWGWTGLLSSLGAVAGMAYHGWKGCRYSWLALSFFLFYSIYGIKRGPGREFWPYEGWAAQKLAFEGRPWGFWYTVIYTLVLTFFGIQAVIRWGFRRNDRFQIWRYASLIGFQWFFFFLLPEFLFQWAVRNQWIADSLARDPSFASQGWRTYGIVYAWPLFFHTFLGSPHQFWIWWGLILTFVIIPVAVLFHGKRYCSWVCGCGGLAETFGDRWRHLAPKGRTALRLEKMGDVVLVIAALVTIAVLVRDATGLFRNWATQAQDWYGLYVDLWLVGLLPMALYPFLGGKVWCRFWCPLAKLMEWMSVAYTRLGISRFAIKANDKCIACGECTRYCQVGIDVMSFALKQQDLTNANTSCIGCGICVTVCPMDVLSFGPTPHQNLIQIQPSAGR